MPKKKKTSKRFPPCPFPEGGVPVKSKEGNYWRSKRGTYKKAELNVTLSKNVEASKVASPAAKRILLKLHPFLRGLSPGRITARLAGKFIRSLNQTGSINFSLLDHFDFQPDFPFDSLLKNYQLIVEKGIARLHIPINALTIEKKNTLVTDYYFEMILLWGDATKERSLLIESAESLLYSYEYKGDTQCVLQLPLPAGKKQWMILLKINSLEGNEVAVHPKHYGLRVIRVNEE